MRYKVGDKVRIKSIDWYNENKDEFGEISCSHGVDFVPLMADYCGKEFTIKSRSSSGRYELDGDAHDFEWTEDMIECLVEEGNSMKIKTERAAKRYDIAKTVMAGLAAHINDVDGKEAAQIAVKWADALLAELEKTE